MEFCNITSTKFHLFWEFRRTEKPLNVATSRVGNHRLSTHLLVAFSTNRATCHQEEDAKMGECSITIYQSWLLSVWAHLVSYWAKFNKCSARKIYGTELYSGLVCYFSKSMLQDWKHCVPIPGSPWVKKDREAEAISGEAAPDGVTASSQCGPPHAFLYFLLSTLPILSCAAVLGWSGCSKKATQKFRHYGNLLLVQLTVMGGWHIGGQLSFTWSSGIRVGQCRCRHYEALKGTLGTVSLPASRKGWGNRGMCMGCLEMAHTTPPHISLAKI